MKSNVINILNMDEGHDKAIREVKKVADYEGLEHKESMQLQLLAEEMLGRPVSPEMKIRAKEAQIPRLPHA